MPAGASAGTYYIIAVADANGAVVETSETNNIKYITVKIGADLIVSTLSGPSTTVTPGQVINLSEATKNRGTVTAGASVTKFYWSTNSSYDGTDVYLGERSVASLGSGDDFRSSEHDGDGACGSECGNVLYHCGSGCERGGSGDLRDEQHQIHYGEDRGGSDCFNAERTEHDGDAGAGDQSFGGDEEPGDGAGGGLGDEVLLVNEQLPMMLRTCI